MTCCGCNYIWEEQIVKTKLGLINWQINKNNYAIIIEISNGKPFPNNYLNFWEFAPGLIIKQCPYCYDRKKTFTHYQRERKKTYGQHENSKRVNQRT